MASASTASAAQQKHLHEFHEYCESTASVSYRSYVLSFNIILLTWMKGAWGVDLW